MTIREAYDKGFRDGRNQGYLESLNHIRLDKVKLDFLKEYDPPKEDGDDPKKQS